MTAATHTIREPIVGVQQLNVVSDTQQHQLGFRVRGVSAGIERDYIYGQAAAGIAAAGAATYAPATGSITASGGAIAGTMVAAIANGQYGYMMITAE